MAGEEALGFSGELDSELAFSLSNCCIMAKRAFEEDLFGELVFDCVVFPMSGTVLLNTPDIVLLLLDTVFWSCKSCSKAFDLSSLTGF